MEAYIGMIVPFAFDYVTDGWLKCDGSLVSISTYQALFALIGTTYGGNGTTTFGLPNLQGRVPIGFGQGPGLSNYVLGQTAGNANVTITTAQMPAHTHVPTFAPSGSTPLAPPVATLNGINSLGNAATPGGAYFANGHTPAGNYLAASGGTPVAMATGSLGLAGGGGQATGGTVTVAPYGGGTPISVMQPYQAVNYMICWAGLYPSQN